MITCAAALMLFLQSHQFDDGKFGWFMGDGNTSAYTFFIGEKDEKTNKRTVSWWAFNHIANDSKVPVKKTGSCVSQGRIYPVLQLTKEVKE